MDPLLTLSQLLLYYCRSYRLLTLSSFFYITAQLTINEFKGKKGTDHDEYKKVLKKEEKELCLKEQSHFPIMYLLILLEEVEFIFLH